MQGNNWPVQLEVYELLLWLRGSSWIWPAEGRFDYSKGGGLESLNSKLHFLRGT